MHWDAVRYQSLGERRRTKGLGTGGWGLGKSGG
jgi:hypothetical protein